MKLAIATCANNPSADAADAPFLTACRTAGIEAVRTVWNDPHVDWTSFDACLVRTTWDWHTQPERFREWIRQAARATTLINPAELLEWSLDKRYLADLAARGVACVPTQFVSTTDRAAVREAVSVFGYNQCVIKPTLGATAWRTALIDSPAALDAWFSQNKDFAGMLAVQPYFDTITSWGEMSLVYIDGRLSHAVKKLPGHGDFRVQRDFGGSAVTVECPPVERELGERCIAALPHPALYGRIDMIRNHAGKPLVIECELVEPDLFFDHHPASSARLVEVCRRAIGGWTRFANGDKSN